MFQVEEAQIIEDLTHPYVTVEPELVKKRISIYNDAYEATKDVHAIVVCTEWDEFLVISFNILISFICSYSFYGSKIFIFNFFNTERILLI